MQIFVLKRFDKACMIENEHKKKKKKDKAKFNQMQLVLGRVKLSLGNTLILLWVYLIYIIRWVNVITSE